MPTTIANETARLAGILGRTVDSVRQDLVAGLTVRTVGAEYSLAYSRPEPAGIRQLGDLRPGERFLDVASGWRGMVTNLRPTYDGHTVAVDVDGCGRELNNSLRVQPLAR